MCIKGWGEENLVLPPGWADDVAWVNSSESTRSLSIYSSVKQAIDRRASRSATTSVVGLDLEFAIPHNNPLGYWRHQWHELQRELDVIFERAKLAAGNIPLAPYPLGSVNQYDAIATSGVNLVQKGWWERVMPTHIASIIRAAGGGCVEHYFDTGTNQAHDAAVVSATWAMGTPAFGTRSRTAIVMPEIAFGASAGTLIGHERFANLLSLLQAAGYARTLVFGGVGGPGEKTVGAWNAWLQNVMQSDV